MPTISRRNFIKQSGSCGAYLMALMAVAPASMRNVFSRQQENEKLYEEEWGWIEKLSDNVWSHIATPFENSDYTTTSNGGIIAGKERVLAIESFMQPKGATWLAERCKELTGRWPTDVVVTHYHADHVGGSLGYKTEDGSPTMWLTEKTIQLVKESQAEKDEFTLLDDITTIADGETTEIDLGGQIVKLNAVGGHTPSDVVIEVVDPEIIFSGDLYWNNLVPNFRDTEPSRLATSVKGLLSHEGAAFVPGHGPMANVDDLKRFQEFLGVMENAAKKAKKAGMESTAAAAEFNLEGQFSDWYVFADNVIPGIFAAWYRELDSNH